MSRNFELLQQAGRKPELFRAPLHTVDSVAFPSCQPIPVPKPEPEHAAPRLGAPSLPWREWVQEKVRSWGEQLSKSELKRGADANSIAREEGIKLVERIFPVGNHNSPHIVLFSSVEAGLGSQEICARAIEILAARAEGPVCLVDAVSGSPLSRQFFGFENGKGLADAVLDSGPILDFAQQLPRTSLWMMPVGTAVSQLSTLSYSDRLRSRITELRSAFQYVLIHSVSLSTDILSISLSHLADGVVLVLEANSTRRERARQVKKSLDAAGVRVLGVVLNNRTYPIPEALYRRL